MQINGHEEMCDRYVQTIRSLYPLVDHPSDIDAICIISAEVRAHRKPNSWPPSSPTVIRRHRRLSTATASTSAQKA
ncbi:MAG: hypothetical protein ACLVJ6_03470 [Merdibacter sp.]